MLSKRVKSLTKRAWWMTVLAGAILIVFGLMALFWPGMTLGALIGIFLTLVIIMGVFSLVESIASIKEDPLWWLSLLFSIVCIGIGIFLLNNPEITTDLIVVFLAIFIFAHSLVALIVASYAGKDDGRGLWILSGLLGIVFGFIVIFFPRGAFLASTWLLGIYALAQGITIETYAVKVRNRVKKLTAKTKKKNKK